MELTVHGFLFMEQICIGFSFLKSYGAIAVTLHGVYAHVTFKSRRDAEYFSCATKGATLDGELTVRVVLNEFLN